MKPRKLVHKPVEAEAICVESPYKDISSFTHRSRLVKEANGRSLAYVHLVDCPDKAYPGQWILRETESRKIRVYASEGEMLKDWGEQ